MNDWDLMSDDDLDMAYSEPPRKWYTVTVQGSPVEGSTNDLAEAERWLAQANRFYEGEAIITTTTEPLAN